MSRKSPDDLAAQATGKLDEILRSLDPASAAAIRDEIARLRADIVDLGQAVSGIGKAGGAMLGEGAKAAIDAGRTRFEGTQAEIESYVRDRPTQAMVVAAGAGLVLGLLMARR